jgi:hypothetical protein
MTESPERAERLRSLEDLTERLSLLSHVSTVLTTTLDVDEILRRLAKVIVPRLADWVAVILWSGDEIRRVTVTHRDGPKALPDDWDITMPPVPAIPRDPLPRALREGVAAILDPDEITAAPFSPLQARQDELFRRLGAESVLIVPLRTPREVLGSLTAARVEPGRPYCPDDLDFLLDIAGRAALGIENAWLFEQQRNVAEAMQRHLLGPLPENKRLRLEARYVPAPRGSQVGGDWYDVFPLPGGSLAVAVGDVAGHDLRAASAMAQLRSILRAIACDRDESPACVVGRVDSVMSHTADASLATLVFGRLEGDGGAPMRLRWTSAGHPPPLLIAPGGPRYLDAGQDVLLGLDLPGAGRADATEPLPPGSTVLFYTDGLVESRTSSIHAGMPRLLKQAAALAHRPLPPLCDQLVARRPSDCTDDVVLLAVHIVR